MSEKAPDTAEQLRRRANRRLLGASILLLIAIIAVPMFLEREPPPLPDNVDVRIPPVEGTKFEPKFPNAADKKAADKLADKAEKPAEIPAINEPTGAQAAVAAAAVAAPVSAVAAAAAVASTAPTKPAATPAPAPASTSGKPAAPLAEAPPVAPSAQSKPPAKSAEKPAEKPVAKAQEKAADKAADKAPPEAERKAGQLVVQVIAVRDAAVAKQMFDKARGLKFPVYTEKIDVSNGVVTRVRVGPYATKQQAEAARGKLAQAGFEAKVLTLQ